MPRNIEYNLEQAIKNYKVPDFVLTFAIQSGIFVPQKVLKQFGKSYGFDNEHPTTWSLRLSEALLKQLTQPNKQKAFDSFRQMKKPDYEKKLRFDQWHETTKNDLVQMKLKVSEFSTNKERQFELKETMLQFLDREIERNEIELVESTAKYESELTLLNEDNLAKMMEYEISDLKETTAYIKRQLYEDPIFCREIASDWLTSKN